LLPSSTQQVSASDPGKTPQDLNNLFSPFWQAWKIVHDQYVDQPLNDETLMRGAIKGMLDSIGDKHTSYMDPTTYTELNTAIHSQENYDGIGAWVDPTGQYLKIISPMPDSPAEKAGLKSGDEIIAVDGQDVTGIDGEVVRNKIVGPAGTTVHLTVSRKGSDTPLEFDIVRASINVPSVDSRMLDNNIAYVHLMIFADKTDVICAPSLENCWIKNPRVSFWICAAMGEDCCLLL
jgi:carboxyl-terminal processing protease